MRRPSVIISISGSAASLNVSQRLRDMFCKGLVTAARATDAILFTGGMASGVMSLAGDAVSGSGGHGITLVGFAPCN